MHRHIALMGFMGSGKTTVGAEVAQRLGFAFVDLDRLIEMTAGRTIPQIFAAEGEPGFRRRERAALQWALAAPRSQVIALGGGAVEDPGNVARLHRRAWLVWLAVAWPLAQARLQREASARPLLAGRPPAEWAALFERRQLVYRRAGPDWVVDAGTGDPEAIADAVVTAWRAGRCLAGDGEGNG